MQIASNQFKSAIKQPFRNRAYIKAIIGVFNHEAQDEIKLDAENSNMDVEWWSDLEKPFQSYKVTKEYATRERGFCKLDGSRYFIPSDTQDLYNNGLVFSNGVGEVYFSFDSEHSIKGLTVNFGCNYPTKFKIKTDGSNGVHNYSFTNDKEVFTTEEVFEDIDSFGIIIEEMNKPDTNLRILELYCGIVNSFMNDEVLNYSWKEYVSSIADTIPSQDMKLVVDNSNMYYSPNNPDSTLAFMELGQDISVSFGYDIDGSGNIEWVAPVNAYLKSWSASEKDATFTATDIFDYQLNGTYDLDVYHTTGISLYDLALQVFNSAGITDTRKYKIDKYLQNVIVYNPLPKCTYAEALQIIANAGRCALLITRDNQICLRSSFVPTTTVTTDSLSDYGSISNIMSSSAKDDYAIRSKGYNKVDGTLKFFDDTASGNVGYVSSAYYSNNSWDTTAPQLTVSFEAEWTFYGLGINFKNVHPEELKIYSYQGTTLVKTKTYTVDTLTWSTDDEFDDVDKLVIEFTKGSDESYLFIDSVLINDITSYSLTRTDDIIGTATAERNSKTKSISVTKYNYKTTTEEKELANGEITLEPFGYATIQLDMSNPSYDYILTVEGNGSGTIQNSSVHMAECTIFTGSNVSTTIKYSLKGKEYSVDTSTYTAVHNTTGEVVTWNNPLISNEYQAKDLEEWLSDYYLGTASYTIPWRGDPRVDANDLFYIETANRGKDLIRVYQNELTYNGAWKGNMKGRVADLTWQ